MKLIVGLGNPGREYDKTRHNTGFMCIDQLANDLNVSLSNNKFKGQYCKTKYEGEDIILLKPQTYMNLSGESVIQFVKYFKIDPLDVLVIYDDLDLPTGVLRLREKGSAGGHNGIKSIIQHLGTSSFKRIRVGIEKDKVIPVVDYVLGKFTNEQQPKIEEGVVASSKAVRLYLEKGFNIAMNLYNSRK